jgi:hypothetical protein
MALVRLGILLQIVVRVPVAIMVKWMWWMLLVCMDGCSLLFSIDFVLKDKGRPFPVSSEEFLFYREVRR